MLPHAEYESFLAARPMKQRCEVFPEVRVHRTCLALTWGRVQCSVSAAHCVLWRFVLCARLLNVCVMWVIPAEADPKWPTAHCIVSGIKFGQETGFFLLQQTKWTLCKKNLKFQVENVEGGKNAQIMPRNRLTSLAQNMKKTFQMVVGDPNAMWWSKVNKLSCLFIPVSVSNFQVSQYYTMCCEIPFGWQEQEQKADSVFVRHTSMFHCWKQTEQAVHLSRAVVVYNELIWVQVQA